MPWQFSSLAHSKPANLPRFQFQISRGLRGLYILVSQSLLFAAWGKIKPDRQVSWYDYWWPLKKQNILNTSCLSRKVFLYMKCDFLIQFFSLESWFNCIQLHLHLCCHIAKDLIYIFLQLLSNPKLKHSRWSVFPMTLQSVFVSLWEGDNQGVRLKKTSDSVEWDRKVSSAPELPLQIVALSSAWVYLLDGGGGEMTR